MGCVLNPREAESIIYAEVVRCAEEQREMSTCDDLSALLGGSAVSTTVGILQRLERKGRIRIKRYQRSRQVYVVELGKATKEPANRVPHWRDRRETPPAIHHQTLGQYDKPLTDRVMKAAQREGKTPPEFIAMLVQRGFADYEAEARDREIEMENAA